MLTAVEVGQMRVLVRSSLANSRPLVHGGADCAGKVLRRGRGSSFALRTVYVPPSHSLSGQAGPRGDASEGSERRDACRRPAPVKITTLATKAAALGNVSNWLIVKATGHHACWLKIGRQLRPIAQPHLYFSCSPLFYFSLYSIPSSSI